MEVSKLLSDVNKKKKKLRLVMCVIKKKRPKRIVGVPFYFVSSTV